jgi:4-hydroxyphenylpyruvate dioxygenase
MEYYAYKGLETGSRDKVCHVVRSGKVVFEFQSPLGPENKDMNKHLAKHGDGVKDICFEVEDCRKVYETAVSRGAKSIQPVTILKDEDGCVIIAAIQTYGDTIHTLLQLNDYKGVYLPGYSQHHREEAFNKLTDPVDIRFVDHVVGNQSEGDMTPTSEWYFQMLDFHRFWSVDDSVMHTDTSALRSVVVSDWDENVKMPLNEPATAKRKSQIQEYVDYYGGPGVQHIALNTPDIIKCITALRSRGVQFLSVPKTYYDNLRKEIPNLKIKIAEDIQMLEKLQILVDFEEKYRFIFALKNGFLEKGAICFKFLRSLSKTGLHCFLNSSKGKTTMGSVQATLRVFSRRLKTNRLFEEISFK